MRCQPVFRRRIDQRLDLPGLRIDLLARLQRIAPIDEQRGFLHQHDRKPRRSGEAGQPRQPFLGRRNIFILLLVCAGDHEAGQLPPRQFLAECGQPRRQRNAAFGFFERLEMGLEHAGHFMAAWAGLQCKRNRHNLA